MDWNKIKQNYPKASIELMNWLAKSNGIEDPDKVDKFILMNLLKDRDLYDFFDQARIFIKTDPEGFANYRAEFRCTIKQPNILNYLSDFGDSVGSSRSEAEQSAFEKAFEILEQKL